MLKELFLRHLFRASRRKRAIKRLRLGSETLSKQQLQVLTVLPSENLSAGGGSVRPSQDVGFKASHPRDTVLPRWPLPTSPKPSESGQTAHFSPRKLSCSNSEHGRTVTAQQHLIFWKISQFSSIAYKGVMRQLKRITVLTLIQKLLKLCQVKYSGNPPGTGLEVLHQQSRNHIYLFRADFVAWWRFFLYKMMMKVVYQ